MLKKLQSTVSHLSLAMAKPMRVVPYIVANAIGASLLAGIGFVTNTGVTDAAKANYPDQHPTTEIRWDAKANKPTERDIKPHFSETSNATSAFNWLNIGCLVSVGLFFAKGRGLSGHLLYGNRTAEREWNKQLGATFRDATARISDPHQRAHYAAELDGKTIPPRIFPFIQRAEIVGEGKSAHAQPLPSTRLRNGELYSVVHQREAAAAAAQKAAADQAAREEQINIHAEAIRRAHQATGRASTPPSP